MADSIAIGIADQLVKARLNHCQWNTLSSADLITIDDAYAIQEIVTQRLGAKTSAWKTSAPIPYLYL